MGNIETIIFTAVTTLIVTVIAGLAIEFFKKIKPKLILSVKESIPINLNDTKIGANVIEVSNPSSKTVKDIVIRVKSDGVDIKNNGIKSTTGLDFDVFELGDVIEIKIPFLKFKDYISITTIMESKYAVPNKPNVTIRSPDQFKTISESRNEEGFFKKFDFTIVPAAVAAMVVGFTVSNGTLTNMLGARNDQSSMLALTALKVDLPSLVDRYSDGTDFTYYEQGPYIYSLARNSNNNNLIDKYYYFLEMLVDEDISMNPSSKSALEFFLGKICILKVNCHESDDWFKLSKDTDKSEFNYLSRYMQ